ncbi:MAG: tetratricopeptide repeat protein, partial [Bacteroidia bacterium]|nr:tetratricopeptide repeat protein [Bacteroidia bacterium]
DYYDAYLQLAMIFHAKNNKLALQYYDGALRINPKSVDAYYGRGLWYQENLRDYDKAIQDYTSATQLNPRAARAHYALGYLHYQYLKVYDQAIRHYNDAIASDSTWPEAWFNRGLSYEASGNIGAANADYRKALQLNPAYKNAADALGRVSQSAK